MGAPSPSSISAILRPLISKNFLAANGCALSVIAFLLWSRTQAWQRVSDHVSLAHLLSASASWWAIRGVIPIHSTGVPNATMTLPPLAVTAYRSSPSSSGVRAPWVNLPVSPSGVPWARVSAFIAWIVSAPFACCTASLNHRSPWCSSSCIMVSILARSLDVSSVEARQRHAKASGGLRLHLCETGHRTEETRRPSRSPRAYRACRAAQCWKAASWSPLVVVTLSSLPRTFCFLGHRPTPRGFKTDGSPARSVYVDAYKYLARRRHHG